MMPCATEGLEPDDLQPGLTAAARWSARGDFPSERSHVPQESAGTHTQIPIMRTRSLLLGMRDVQIF